MKEVDKTTFVQTKQVVDYTTGQVLTEEITTHKKKSAEPPFIKLYLDCLLTFKDLSTTLNPILLELLKYMSYADSSEEDGGQIIYLNSEIKRKVAERTGKTVKRVEQALTQFTKAGVFKRTATSTYQVNSYVFGKGDWKDISGLRATFDFVTGEVTTEIECKEEEYV